MRILLAIMAAVTLFSVQQAQAYPGSSNISEDLPATTAGRQFILSRTKFSLGCQLRYSTGCGSPMGPCWDWIADYGLTTSGVHCCTQENIYCRGTDAEVAAVAKEQIVELKQDNLQSAFLNDRVETYWGYIGTTARSPNAGRTNSAPARLDACLSHTEVDAFGSGSSDWMNCYSKCDSSTNGYCNNTGMNNGSSVSNAACKDRCDCVITGFGTCENL